MQAFHCSLGRAFLLYLLSILGVGREKSRCDGGGHVTERPICGGNYAAKLGMLVEYCC